MSLVNLTITLPQLSETEQLLRHIPNGAGKAMMRALNRTIVGVRENSVRSVRDMYTVRGGEFRSLLKINKATLTRLAALITVRGHALGDERFQLNPSKRTGRKVLNGVYVRVRKDSAGGAVKGTFLGVGKFSKATLLFRRLTNDRLPIEHIHGPSIASMVKMAFYNPGSSIEDDAKARLVRELSHEIEYQLLKKAGAR
ncbi:MAG TPA: phage tail protein [Armatimonadota bacterium]|jgi:hypothetical protein